MKISGTLLAGDTPADTAIVSTVVSLAHALGLSVTAEGVETRPQSDRLRELGCDAGQGWFYGHPAGPGELARLFTTPAG